MSRGSGTELSQRQLRVAEQMRHLLAERLLRGDLHDPRLRGRSLTISEVRVSRDLKSATVYTAELGGSLDPEVAEALRHAAAHLGGWLAREMHLKYAPKLRFVADETFAQAARIDELLRDARLPHQNDEDDDDGAA
ncbi:30S ribosome-binding factor RbfA [Benzoatithermus flavus]|uniref:Ribosome-binding factor A n=1 Tax=Benzoatithermus flavus TaxID=3108223 RepID=A0ABU8XVH2_9PROT